MSDIPNNSKPTSLARRHFLAASSAAAVRLAAMTTVSSILMTSGASAGRRRIRPRGRPRPGGPLCFLKGTRIATRRGEVPVEDLRIGDLVVTVRGLQPVTWIGRRSYTRSGAPWNKEVRPIRFRPGAIADGVPSRDLYLSPWHSLFLDGFLMPAKDLVNDATITSEAPHPGHELEYYNIAFREHEVVLAEGVQADSLLIQNGEHEFFSNFAEYERLYGDEERAPMLPFAPELSYSGGRSHLAGLLRLSLSGAVDLRDPIQKAYQRLAARAEGLVLLQAA
jgi:hypothetical protein